jgi:TolB protein
MQSESKDLLSSCSRLAAHVTYFPASKHPMKKLVARCAAAILLCVPLALAQNSPLGIAYQFSHSVNDSPSFSPDGQEMVFISVVAGKEQLFRMHLDGTHVIQLTRDDADHEDPAWSPDGKRIAFVLMRDGIEQVHLMNADGTGVEPLTPSGVKTIHPNWNPDGRSLAYCTDDDLKPPKKNPAQIYSIDIATRKITQLIEGGVNTYPAWSPDGKRIAFRRMVGETNSEVFLANADGNDAQNLTNDPAFDGWPAWSPDGSKIAFASNRRGSYEIYIMNPDGTGVRKVANNEGRATAPQWTRDGKSIFFPLCYKVALSFDCQIYAVKLDTFAK